MMGRREGGQGQFFYSFDLDRVVPPDHLVRQIDGILDLSWVHKELAPYYSHTGRPSIDPVLMIQMLLVGYVFAIRSERRLCSEVQVNLAYRWFCKLSIEDSIPDHSVFCRARHERFRESEALRRVFEGVVAKCIAAGLVGGEALSVDASLIKADVDKKKRMPGDQPIAWPKAEEASRAVREYLTALDNARTDEENDGRDGDDSGSGGGRRRKPPKEVSLTDPQAAWVARKGTDPLFAYDANYLIDNKAGIIVDAEGTRANRIAEIAVAQTMLERVRRTTAVVRKVTRDLQEEVRDRVRDLANTEAFQRSGRERKKVEMRFAHMKRILKLDRLRLRGLTGVKDVLTATAQNLRRLAKLLCRPAPTPAACPA